MNREELQKEICRQLCADIRLVRREDGKHMISTPFSYPDGDHYSIYVQEVRDGVVRLSDEANTIMRLSYDTPNVEKYFRGKSGELIQQIMREHQVEENKGKFFVDVAVGKIADGVFRLGQALSQVYDLSYLSRERVASTFYEDLDVLLKGLIEKITHELPVPVALNKKHIVPDMENAENYPVDYALQLQEKPALFLFGIPHADKAHLVTIILQHFLLKKNKTPRLLILADQAGLPGQDYSRLMNANVGGSQVVSLDAVEEIQQNIMWHVH